MAIRYIFRRVILFVAVIFAAATVNFTIPRMAPGNPIGAVLEELTSRGQRVEGVKEIIEAYQKQFGLDQLLWKQYLNDMIGVVFRFDPGYSLSFFPAKVE